MRRHERGAVKAAILAAFHGDETLTADEVIKRCPQIEEKSLRSNLAAQPCIVNVGTRKHAQYRVKQ